MHRQIYGWISVLLFISGCSKTKPANTDYYNPEVRIPATNFTYSQLEKFWEYSAYLKPDLSNFYKLANFPEQNLLRQKAISSPKHLKKTLPLNKPIPSLAKIKLNELLPAIVRQPKPNMPGVTHLPQPATAVQKNSFTPVINSKTIQQSSSAQAKLLPQVAKINSEPNNPRPILTLEECSRLLKESSSGNESNLSVKKSQSTLEQCLAIAIDNINIRNIGLNSVYINFNTGFASMQFLPTGGLATILNFGYNFSSNLGLEFGYTNIAASEFGALQTNNIYNFALRGNLNLSQSLGLYGRLGGGVNYMSWGGEADYNSPTWFSNEHSSINFNTLVGGGVFFKLSRFDIRLEDTLLIPIGGGNSTSGQTNLVQAGVQLNF